MKSIVTIAAVLAGIVPALAQSANSGAVALNKSQPVRQLLVDGYDIKTGFADNSGGAYLVLQKATSAYLCHSSPNQVCEKLN